MDENIADLDDKISNNDQNSAAESGCSETAANPNDLDTSSDMPVDPYSISKLESCNSKATDEPKDNADNFTVDTAVVSVEKSTLITLLFAKITLIFLMEVLHKPVV